MHWLRALFHPQVGSRLPLASRSRRQVQRLRGRFCRHLKRTCSDGRTLPGCGLIYSSRRGSGRGTGQRAALESIATASLWHDPRLRLRDREWNRRFMELL